MTDNRTGEAPDVEEDDMGDAWCVTHTESCTFVARAVFADERDAKRFAALIRKNSKRYDDVVVLPARSRVLMANSFDVKAGRVALSKEQL